jgi:hypothetical protein
VPARLVQVDLSNRSEFAIHWITDYLDGGHWQDPWFPSRLTDVQPGQDGAWRSESDWIFGGTAGWALFGVDSPGFGEFLFVSWSRPYWGWFNWYAHVSRQDPRQSGDVPGDPPPKTEPFLVHLGPLGSDENALGELIGAVVMDPVTTLISDAAPGHHVHVVFELRKSSVGTPLTSHEPPEVQTTVQQFQWTAPITSCSTSLPALAVIEGAGEGWVAAEATAEINNTGGGQLLVERVTPKSADPDLLFRPERIAVDAIGGDSYLVTVRLPYSSAYFQHPYPCELTIETNGGRSDVSLGTIPDLDDSILAELRIAAHVAIAECPVTIADWGLLFRGLPLKWLIDPLPNLAVVYRLWAIEVGGMPAGASFYVINNVTKATMHAVTGTDGIGRVAMLTDPAHGDALEIVRSDEIPVEVPDELYLLMKQTEFVMSAVPPNAVALASGASMAVGATFALVPGRSLTA